MEAVVPLTPAKNSHSQKTTTHFEGLGLKQLQCSDMGVVPCVFWQNPLFFCGEERDTKRKTR